MAWTTYPQIDETLEQLLSGSRGIFGADFVGMYVLGSLASGDFDEDTSDIDFVVVTAAGIDAEAQAELGRLCQHLQATGSPWAAKLEGSFLPLQAFRNFNPASIPFPTIGMGGRYGLKHKGIEHAIQRCLLREDGIALAGPEPSTFIDPVEPEELRKEVLDLLHGWWKPRLDDPIRMKRRGYQAYAVLTMCRTLHTLEAGRLASKPAAARWARERHPERWRGLIDRALGWKQGDGVDDFTLTLDFIRYVLDQATAN